MRQIYFIDSIKMCSVRDVDKYIEIPTPLRSDNFHSFIQNKPNEQLQNNVQFTFTFELFKEASESKSQFCERVTEYFNCTAENHQYILKICFGSPVEKIPYQKEIEVQLLLETRYIDHSVADLREFKLNFMSVHGSLIKEISCNPIE